MNDIGKEYGAALFMLAAEENARDEYAASLEKLENIFREEAEYLSFLSSPGIALCERLSAIEAAFAEILPQNVLSFVQLMCEKGRIENFFEAAEEYYALLNASKHISCAKVISAVEITSDEKDRLHSKLAEISGGEVEIEYSVDASLLGGIIVELDGKIMDGSLRNRLREIKDVINS